MRPNLLVRAVLPAALIVTATLFLQARSRPEKLPDHKPLEELPAKFDDWSGRDLTIAPDVREVLGDGKFLERWYTSPTAPPVDLFVAYFETQRTGSTMHSPKNCLPGSGWTPVDSGYLRLQTPTGLADVNRYVIARGSDKQIVLYWYQSHGRYIASEYSAKIHLVLDSIRMNRSDGALVRLVTPVVGGETPAQATNRLVNFASQVVTRLDIYIPR